MSNKVPSEVKDVTEAHSNLSPSRSDLGSPITTLRWQTPSCAQHNSQRLLPSPTSAFPWC